MLTRKEINDRINVACNDMHVSPFAKKIILSEKLFFMLRNTGGKPSMYEQFHCCGDEETGWLNNCWCEVYAVGVWNATEEGVWLSIMNVFNEFAEESKKNPMAFIEVDERHNTILVNVTARHCDGRRNRDFNIVIENSAHRIKKYFPELFFTGRIKRNCVPLREAAKLNIISKR